MVVLLTGFSLVGFEFYISFYLMEAFIIHFPQAALPSTTFFDNRETIDISRTNVFVASAIFSWLIS